MPDVGIQLRAECIEISWSVTLGAEASQAECIEISRSVTLVQRPVSRRVQIRRSVTLGTEFSQPQCI